MKDRFGRCGDDIFKFIRVLYNEALFRQQLIWRLIPGGEPPHVNKEIEDRNKRICTVVGEYAQRERLDFLRGIAYNFRLG